MTVFLALLLSVFLGLTGILLDFARAQAVSAQTQAAVSAAAESVFAGYHAPLFARYQLLGRQLPEDGLPGLSRETASYMDAWAGGGRRLNLTAFRTESAEWSDLVYLTDGGGTIFREMAARSMRAAGVSILASFWQDHLGLSDSGTMDALREHADGVKPGQLFPNYKELKERIAAAEQAEKEAEERAEEEARKAEEARQAALAAGQEPPPAVPAPKPTEEERQAARDRKRGRKFLDLLDTLRRLLTRGVLAVTLPEGKKVSGARIPSVSLRFREGGGGSAGSVILFREYLMRNMDCFTSESDKSPLYELEYLIAGRKTDRANLESAASRLFGIRLGLNLLTLSRAPEKQAVTQEAALLAVGWTGQPALVEVVSALLTTAWAAAESLADVRVLLSGGRVVLVKTDADWQLSLEEAGKGWKYAEGASPTDERGLSYEDYLRICLYLSSLSSQTRRAMEVVQWNVQTIDRNFRLDDCFVEGTLCAETAGRVLFRPLYGFAVRGRDGGMVFRRQSRFSYRTSGG